MNTNEHEEFDTEDAESTEDTEMMKGFQISDLRFQILDRRFQEFRFESSEL